jgi:hypothetical protein
MKRLRLARNNRELSKRRSMNKKKLTREGSAE